MARGDTLVVLEVGSLGKYGDFRAQKVEAMVRKALTDEMSDGRVGEVSVDPSSVIVRHALLGDTCESEEFILSHQAKVRQRSCKLYFVAHSNLYVYKSTYGCYLYYT